MADDSRAVGRFDRNIGSPRASLEEEREPEYRLDDTQEHEFLVVFRMLDRHGDGLITRPDIRRVLHTMGADPSERELDFVIQEIGGANDVVAAPQFLKWIAKKMNQDLREELAEMWRLINPK